MINFLSCNVRAKLKLFHVHSVSHSCFIVIKFSTKELYHIIVYTYSHQKKNHTNMRDKHWCWHSFQWKIMFDSVRAYTQFYYFVTHLNSQTKSMFSSKRVFSTNTWWLCSSMFSFYITLNKLINRFPAVNTSV